MDEKRVLLRQVLKTQSYRLIWRKTVVTLAYMPERVSKRREFMRPVLVADRSSAGGDCTIIALDGQEKQKIRVRLVAPTRQDASSNVFVLRFGSNPTILRFRAPNAEVYEKWTTAIIAAIGSGHEHPSALVDSCDRCCIVQSDYQHILDEEAKAEDNPKEYGGSADNALTLPVVEGAATETLAVPADSIPSGRWSYSSSAKTAYRVCADAAALSFHVHRALIRGDYTEKWTMEARKNMLLRINAASLRVADWNIESVLSVMRLRAIRTFYPTFDVFGDTKRIVRKQADAFVIMCTNFHQNVFVIADVGGDCGRSDSSSRVDSDGCSCRTCISKFRVYSPLYDHQGQRMRALEWVQRLSGEVLKAQRCPVVVHAKDQNICSLLRFSELQFKPSSKSQSSRPAIELTSSFVEQYVKHA